MRNAYLLISTLVAVSVIPSVAKALPSWVTGHTEYHVSVLGNDDNKGSGTKPFKTVSAAALKAQPGDTITVHEGTYREHVSPLRGGTSDKNRITYQAAAGEKVIITGSEPVKQWEKAGGDTWKTTLPNTFFGPFNPYSDLIRGDWFDPCGRQHHTGCVYLDGNWMIEARTLDEVLKPASGTPLWFGQVNKDTTTIWAQFKDINPNGANVEINVRQTVFYPAKTNINFITVRGFTLENAAVNWAPPSAEQKGVIGTHWSKGWIIENNTVRNAKCSGIALGKYGDEFDNTNAAGAANPYTDCVRRALSNGWNKVTVGSHLVRNNHIYNCEQAGIVGSMGCAFSTVTGNLIHDIHVRRLFSGAEMGGIKFHGAIDVKITGNHIFRTMGHGGIWLDWMAQGTQVTGNLFHDNSRDLFCEVDHGPFLVANNLFLSPDALLTDSRGGAFTHNLIMGSITVRRHDSRQTPFMKAHSTEMAGLHDNPCGDDRFYNNMLGARANLSSYNNSILPVWMEGNVYFKGAIPCSIEKFPLLKPDSALTPKLVEQQDGFHLECALDKSWSTGPTRPLVKTSLLGMAAIPKLPFENPDGSPLTISTDYFGKKRNLNNPTPGPFEIPEGGALNLKVWPKTTGE